MEFIDIIRTSIAKTRAMNGDGDFSDYVIIIPPDALPLFMEHLDSRCHREGMVGSLDGIPVIVCADIKTIAYQRMPIVH